MSNRCKSTKMESVKEKFISPQKINIQELAKLAGCTRQTASDAIYKNRAGLKSEKVRQIYRAKYKIQ